MPPDLIKGHQHGNTWVGYVPRQTCEDTTVTNSHICQRQVTKEMSEATEGKQDRINQAVTKQHASITEKPSWKCWHLPE